MGTGCDTILTQIAAETLLAEMDQFIIAQVDTDISPFDPGSYAPTSTTYVTGMAVYNAAVDLKTKIIYAGAKILDPEKYDMALEKFNPKKFYFDGTNVIEVETERTVSIHDIAIHNAGNYTGNYLNGTGFYSSPTSPPPLMAGFAEIELDKETGKYEVIDYVGVVDCGTVVNTNLARVQTEGGLSQGIGFAMYEDVQYSAKGKMMTDSFMQYKIPSRVDVGNIRVSLSPVMNPAALTGPNPSVRLLSIHRPRPLQMRLEMHAAFICAVCP